MLSQEVVTSVTQGDNATLHCNVCYLHTITDTSTNYLLVNTETTDDVKQVCFVDDSSVVAPLLHMRLW